MEAESGGVKTRPMEAIAAAGGAASFNNAYDEDASAPRSSAAQAVDEPFGVEGIDNASEDPEVVIAAPDGGECLVHQRQGTAYILAQSTTVPGSRSRLHSCRFHIAELADLRMGMLTAS